MQTPLPTLPSDFSSWTQVARQDPEQLVSRLFAHIASLPHHDFTAVFSLLRNQKQLSSEIAKSSQNKKHLFAGIPFLLKDLYDYPGLPTTASSTFLSGLRGIPITESAFSQSIRSLGGCLLGKTNLNEFAYGLSGENNHFGNCPHPQRPQCLSGGSSSGSAYAVAKGIVPLATGTDTGGSIRVPSAWCGIYGIRLSPNEWSQQGCFPLSPSFDTSGWFCKTADNMAESLKKLLKLKTTRSKNPPKGLDLTDAKLLAQSPLRTAYRRTTEQLTLENDPTAQAAFWKATITAAQHYAILQSIEAYQVHKDWLDEYRYAYDPVIWARFDKGRHWKKEDIDPAKKTEVAIKTFFKTAFQTYDYLIMPATWTTAISAAEHTQAFRNNLLSLCAPGSFSRRPILTIPVFNSKKESGGLQIIYKDNQSNLPLRILEQLNNSK